MISRKTLRDLLLYFSSLKFKGKKFFALLIIFGLIILSRILFHWYFHQVCLQFILIEWKWNDFPSCDRCGFASNLELEASAHLINHFDDKSFLGDSLIDKSLLKIALSKPDKFPVFVCSNSSVKIKDKSINFSFPFPATMDSFESIPKSSATWWFRP